MRGLASFAHQDDVGFEGHDLVDQKLHVGVLLLDQRVHRGKSAEQSRVGQVRAEHGKAWHSKAMQSGAVQIRAVKSSRGTKRCSDDSDAAPHNIPQQHAYMQ